MKINVKYLGGQWLNRVTQSNSWSHAVDSKLYVDVTDKTRPIRNVLPEKGLTCDTHKSYILSHNSYGMLLQTRYSAQVCLFQS